MRSSSISELKGEFDGNNRSDSDLQDAPLIPKSTRFANLELSGNHGPWAQGQVWKVLRCGRVCSYLVRIHLSAFTGFGLDTAWPPQKGIQKLPLEQE